MIWSRVYTETAWVARVYGVSACILFVSLVVFGVISAKDEESEVMLGYSNHYNTVILGKHAFNLSTAYITALMCAVIVHIIVALAPQILQPSLQRGRNPARWILLIFTLPALQCITLVGVAAVTDLWAVYACLTNNVLMLLMLAMLEQSTHSRAMANLIAIVLAVVIVIYWVLVWRASGSSNDPFSLAVSCFSSLFLLGSFAITYGWKKRVYVREAVLQTATLMTEIGLPWIWIASSSGSNPNVLLSWGSIMLLLILTGGIMGVAIASARHVTAALLGNDIDTNLILPEIDDDGEEVVVESGPM